MWYSSLLLQVRLEMTYPVIPQSSYLSHKLSIEATKLKLKRERRKLFRQAGLLKFPPIL